MLRNLFILTLVVFALGSADISAQSTNEPVIVSKGVVNGKAISFPKPPYPAEAKKDRLKSIVNVEVTIDEQGNVISAKAVSGNPVFHPSAEKAALGAKFTPTLVEGIPVKITEVIVYNFVP